MTVRASILVNNYNYGRFLRDAVDSALAQTHAEAEVIVVDDGSTDDSRDVLTSYGGRVRAILQPNGGQAAAFNAGVAAAAGDVLFFLDADDVFLPHKVARVLDLMAGRGLVGRPALAFHRLARVDERRGALPAVQAGQGGAAVGDELAVVSTPAEMLEHARRYGFLPNLVPPTSAIAITRELAGQIFPLPTAGVRICADGLVTRAAMLLADVYGTGERLAEYRLHGKNFYAQSKAAPKPDLIAARDAYLNRVLARAGRSDVTVDYARSIYARELFEEANDAGGLVRLGLGALGRTVDGKTVRFALKNVGRAIGMKLGKAPTGSTGEPAVDTAGP